jgi:chromosome segregation ATPase
MATKPVTYPQQIQNLKGQLEQKDEEIRKLHEAVDSIPLLNDEISKLSAKLATGSQQASQNAGATKAQTTDLLQRAESAEKALRAAQAANRTLQQDTATLEQRIDLLGQNEVKLKNLQTKIEFLTGELQNANLRRATVSQQFNDQLTEMQGRLDLQSIELRNLRLITAQQLKTIERYQQHGDERIGPLEKRHENDKALLARVTLNRDTISNEYTRLEKEARSRIKALETTTEKQAGTIRELTIQRDQYLKQITQFQAAVANEANNLSHLREIVGG